MNYPCWICPRAQAQWPQSNPLVGQIVFNMYVCVWGHIFFFCSSYIQVSVQMYVLQADIPNLYIPNYIYKWNWIYVYIHSYFSGRRKNIRQQQILLNKPFIYLNICTIYTRNRVNLARIFATKRTFFICVKVNLNIIYAPNNCG